MKLAYEAYDKTGRRVSQVIDATGIVEAREMLRREGLYVSEMSEAKEERTPQASAVGGRGVREGRRLKQLVFFSRQLYVLVSTGTPLTEALDALERQTKDPRFRAVLGDLRAQVEQGLSLGEAMQRHARDFDPVCRGLVTAGETSGKLPTMLNRLSDLARNRLRVRQSVIGALIYPALMVVVSVGVLGLMMMVVLPRFAGLFESLGVPLPPTTQMLLALSEALRAWWWLWLAGAVAGAIALKVYLRHEAGRRMIQTLSVRTPPVGKITRMLITARVIRLLGILLDSHLPLLDSLKLTRDAVPNHHYASLLENGEQAVVRGEPISTAFADSSLIDPSVYEALRNGEKSGQIAPLLLNVAEFLDDENEVVVRSLSSILEPLILIALGVLVGFVALNLFLPLFDLTAMTG